MLEHLAATWRSIKTLRRHPDPGISIRARTILRNLMRMRETPADPVLQAQTKRNLADLESEIRRQAH